MRLFANFAAERVADHLRQIASEIELGRTFGVGWCLMAEDICPVPGSHRQGCPCQGEVTLCVELCPAHRTGLPSGG
jgi:hypothetical protein